MCIGVGNVEAAVAAIVEKLEVKAAWRQQRTTLILERIVVDARRQLATRAAKASSQLIHRLGGELVFHS